MKKIISFILICCMVMSLLPLSASAADIVASGYCGGEGDGSNLTWKFTENGTLTISGNGAMADYYYDSITFYSTAPWNIYCDSIKSVIIEDGVTNIGNYAFYDCSLVSISIPNSVTSIGDGAFSFCYALTNVMIPDSITSIGEVAFSYCRDLASIIIPNSIISIGEGAFSHCDNLTKITVDINNKIYSSDEYGVLFNKDKTTLIRYPIGNTRKMYMIPNGVISINRFAFDGATNIKSVTIPDGVKSIGVATFQSCTALSSITIPNSVKSIDGGAFNHCDTLIKVMVYSIDVKFGTSTDVFSNCHANLELYGYTGSTVETYATEHHIPFMALDEDSSIPADTAYTRFGKYNGSTQKYITDPTTGFGKNLMETVTIDGFTYNVAHTCEQESVLLPTNYLGDYYYIAYNLNDSNEVSEAKIIPGTVCTLEGYDPATKVVDTDQFAPVIEGSTLPSGSYYVSDVTGSSFPSDQIGSWIGDQVRIYCVGEQIFKVIHVIEGSGVITDYDEINSIVYIDDTGYNVYPDTELINTIKQSILYSKDYVLYDNTLVSLSSDNKYLSVEINNTGKSYFVGDEIRFFIYDCTETEDDYLHWTKPEGLVIQISDNETISLKKHIEYDDFAECVFVADKPGVVTITISDDITSAPINVTLHIAEDKYQSLRADNIPTYEYDIVIDKDFYNAYVNGMYVTDFTYKYNSYGTYTFDFSVYNETYTPGVVEVYNEKGELIDIKTIKKFSDPSSLKSVVYGGKDMIVDLWNGDSFSFRGVSASKKTEISVEVPFDGYVVVTNSCVLSPACLYVNLIDYFLTGTSLIDSTVKFDTDTFDYISRETIWAVLSSEYGTSTLATLHEDFFKEYATTIAQGSVSTIFGIATDNINMLFDSIDVNFEDILKDAGIGYAFSTVQGLLQKGGGPAGAALSAIFYVQKMLNFAMQTMHLANNSTNEIAWAVFTPYIEDRGMSEITSKDGITVKSEVEFPTDTILQVYRIVDYSNTANGLDIDENDNYTLYDISLVRNGQEAQPDKPVTVYIPVPEGYSQSSIMVYKQDQHGDWVFVEVMIYNGMIVFEVDHFCLFAIIEDSKDNYTEHTITFEPNGGTVSINSLSTKSDGKLASLPIATRDGYIFDGWYTDPVTGTQITTSTVFISDTTIYAHWKKDDLSDDRETNIYWLLIQLRNQRFEITATANNGGVITPDGTSEVKYGNNITHSITPDEGYAIADVVVDGESVGAVSEYTFENVKEAHAITALFKELAWENPFGDVDDDDWFYEDIEYAYETGLMIGTSDDSFSTTEIVNRAMLVTVLWRLEGSPIVDSIVNFVDIPSGEWYTDAVNWAAANGIVNGYGDGIFGATNDLTHEQVTAILNRYAVYKKLSENVNGNADDAYTNSEWAENNVLWADLNGMFDGIGSDISNLTKGASRAELAAYLRRFCENVMK